MLSLSAIGKFINVHTLITEHFFSGGTPLKTARQTRGTPLNKLTVDLIKTYKKINDHYYARKRRIKGNFQKILRLTPLAEFSEIFMVPKMFFLKFI